jgi:hypothetical protein
MTWLFTVIALTIMLSAPVMLRRVWRGRISADELGSVAILYSSERLRRGHARATLPVVAAGYGVFSTGFVVLVFPDPAPDQETVLGLLVAFLVICIVLSVVLYWSIVLFNKPKLLVPPPMRDDMGALEARRRRSVS